MKIGDKIILNGSTGVITGIKLPKCKCKGQGYYIIQLDNETRPRQVHITTKLEEYVEPSFIKNEIIKHNF